MCILIRNRLKYWLVDFNTNMLAFILERWIPGFLAHPSTAAKESRIAQTKYVGIRQIYEVF